MRKISSVFGVSCRVLAPVLVLALALGGCAGKTSPQADPFFEKWQAMAKQSPGHTPTRQPLELEEERAQAAEAQAERDLPAMTVGSLDMRNANIVAVLRALGRIAGQSIMVSPKVEGLINVSVRDVPWSQVFRGIVRTHGLTYEWEGDILRVMTVADVEEAVRLDELRNRQALSSATVRIRYADAAKLRETLEKLLTTDSEGKPRGSVELVEHTNALVINAVPDDLRKMSQLIEATDNPSKQIRIKAFIVETTGETARNLGVMWGGAYKRASVGGNGDSLWLGPGGSGGTGDPISGAKGTNFGYTPTLNGGSAGLSNQGAFSNMLPDLGESGRGGSLALMFGTLGGNILEAQLAALQEDNKLNILSSPSITTLDNQTAVTENGEEVPFITLDEAGNAEVEWKEALMRLEITPHLIDAEHMRLNILVNKDEVDFTRSVQGNPLIIKKKTETALISRDGETIVISGLTRKRLSAEDAGIPGLQDVPGLGHLFKSTSKSNTLEEVLIFITPTVLGEWEPGFRQKTIEEIEQDLEKKREEEQAGEGARG